MQDTKLTLALREVFNTIQTSPQEQIQSLSQVIIDLGMAYENLSSKLTKEDIKRIEKEYYVNPTFGKALILQGVLMTTWNIET